MPDDITFGGADGSSSGTANAAAGAPRSPLQIAWRRKWLVLLGLLAGLAAGGLHLAQRRPEYQSRAQLLVVKKQSDVLPVVGGDPRMRIFEDYIATHLVLIRSPLIVDQAVQKGKLQELPSLAATGNPAGAVMGSLQATRDIKESPNIITLSYRGPESEDCGRVLEAVITSYKDFLDETYKSVSDDTLGLITKARDLLEKDLVEKEKEYAEFRDKAPVLTSPATPGKDAAVSPAHARLGEFESKKLSVEIRAAELEEKLRAVEAAHRDGQPHDLVLAMAVARTDDRKGPDPEAVLAQQLLPLLLEEQTLLQDFGEDHPQVRSVRRKIAMTRKYAATEKDSPGANAGTEAERVEACLKTLRQELAGVRLTRQSLDRLADDQKTETRDAVRYEIRDAAFRNEIGRMQQLYEQTIKRLQEINLVRDSGGYRVQAISTPGPGGRVGGGLAQVLVASALAGLLLGYGLAFLAEARDKSFRTPEEIRQRLGLPVIGHVPVLASALPAPERSDAELVPLDATVCAYHDPKAPQAEAFRGIRTALYFSTQGQGHKVLQITSPSMGDGKSTLAANLAVSIAQSGRSILLIDADFRRPRQHLLFGVDAPTGLAALLASTAELPEAIWPTAVPNLSLMPCGTMPPNPAELLTSPHLEALLQSLRDRYDLVLIDTPPLLAVSDPAIIAPRVDGVLLTLRLSRNGRPLAERAQDLLASLGARVVGVVVNGATAEGKTGPGYGYGYGYGYGHGYGYDHDYGNQHKSGEAGNGLASPGRSAAAGKARSRPGRNGRPRTRSPWHRLRDWVAGP